jgi:ATP-dependent DNA ligase
MLKFNFNFCLPTLGKAVPAGPEWFHEIKYDGYRLRLEREAGRIRLITKGGYDWTKRFPRIVEAARRNRQPRFVIDGEAIVRGVDGYSDFNALHSGRQNDEVELIAFDILALDGDDLRNLPLSMRKANLQRPARAPAGRHLSVRLRAGRDRRRSLPQGLRVRPRRVGDLIEDGSAISRSNRGWSFGFAANCGGGARQSAP